ncbi:MAG: hypothetical protein IKR39_12535 [Lachnospiraceae bacterium]|nr:hypothetical protein [Lachnospiraceae bacterium]
MNNISGSASSSPSFKYSKVYEKGKPKHGKDDPFSFKHPSMDCSKRAKIFNPFDALKGFDEELSKTEQSITDAYSEDYSDSVDDGL